MSSILRTTEGLPPGWEKGVDPATGKIFFIDHNTKSTMWDLPQSVKDYVIKNSQIHIQQQQQQQQQQPSPPPQNAIGQFPPQQTYPPQGGVSPVAPVKPEESILGGIVSDISALPPPNQVSVVVPSPIEFAPPPSSGESSISGSSAPFQPDPFFGDLPSNPQPSQVYQKPYGISQQPVPSTEGSRFMPAMPSNILGPGPMEPLPPPPPQAPAAPGGAPGAECANPQAIVVMDKPLLCTGRPGWKAPFAADSDRCAKCRRKHWISRKGSYCPCCMRRYCAECMQQRAVVPSSSSSSSSSEGDAVNVCEACHSHLSREDMRCVPRLVPYVAEKNPSLRLDALRELLVLLDEEGGDRKVGRDEFLAASTVGALRGVFRADADRAEAALAAAILARLLAFGPSSSDRVLEDKGYVAAIVDGADRHGERAPGFAAVIAALAATQPGRRALLETRRVFKALSKALAAGAPEVVPAAVRAVRALASGKEDDPRKNPEAESEFLILSSLSTVLSENGGDGDNSTDGRPGLRSDALAAADKLCYTREMKIFFCQSCGVQNVLHALARAPPATGDVRHGASILYKFAAIEECAPHVAKAAGEILTLAAAAQDDPETQGGLLQVVSKLARTEATKGPATALVVDHAHDFAAVFATLNPTVETDGLRIVLAALDADPARAAPAFAATDIPATLRRIIVSKSPQAHKAFKALASIDPSNLKDFNKFGVTSAVMDGFSKGEWDSISVVASITAEPVAGACVLESPEFVPALVALFGSAEPRVVYSAWSIAANLSTIPGFGVALQSAGGFDRLQAALTAGPAALQTLIVISVGRMCTADNMLSGVLMTEPFIMKLAEFCAAHGEPALQRAAVVACADISRCHAQFFPSFISVGGLDAVTDAAARAEDPVTRERAVYTLTCFVSLGEDMKKALPPGAVIPIFTDTLFSAPLTPARIHAAAGLGYFAFWLTPQDDEAFVNSGTVLALVAAISDSASAAAAAPAAASIGESITRAKLRSNALDTLATLLERSPSCRKAALESSALTAATAALRSSVAALRSGDDDDDDDDDDSSEGGERKKRGAGGDEDPVVNQTVALWRSSLKVLQSLFSESPEAQAEFCAGGGMDLLRKLAERNAEAKGPALTLFTELSEKCPQAAAAAAAAGGSGGRMLENVADVIPLLGAQDPHVRERALGVVAGLAASDPEGVTAELVARRCIPPVIATFISAQPDSPAKRDSLLVIAAAWQSGNADALALLAKFQAVEHVAPVLGSKDPATTVPALVVLSLARMPEEKIVPGVLTTDLAIANLCAAATAASSSASSSAPSEQEGPENDGKMSSLEMLMSGSGDNAAAAAAASNPTVSSGRLAARMALYILSVLIRRCPDAVRPHLCGDAAVPRLFAHLCATGFPAGEDDGDEDRAIFASTVGVLLLALRQGPELRDRLLTMPSAAQGLDALFLACPARDDQQQPALAANSAEVLAILAGAPGKVFTALAEQTKYYALVADALAAAASSPTAPLVRSLLLVLCVVLRSEGARSAISRSLGLDAFRVLLLSGDPSVSGLAVSAAGALACTNAFRASQGPHAAGWAALLAGALADPRAAAEEDATVRALTAVVGFAPCAAFREAFSACEELVGRVAAAAANSYMARAQTLAIRALGLLRVHGEARALFDATVAQPHQSAGVLAEALRFYANLPHETLWDLFAEDERRIQLLWETRRVNPTPASIIMLFSICTKLAEDDALRGKMAALIPLEELARLAETFPYVADYAVLLKICLGF